MTNSQQINQLKERFSAAFVQVFARGKRLFQAHKRFVEGGERLVRVASAQVCACGPRQHLFRAGQRGQGAGYLAMRLPEDCVNVKATTTEGMGFEGEGLGISAQAAVMITKG